MSEKEIQTPEIIYISRFSAFILSKGKPITTALFTTRDEDEDIEYILKSKHDTEIAELKKEIERLKNNSH